MSKYKEDVIKLIDEVLEFKQQLKRCFCEGEDGEVYECDNCQTKRVLREARVCIIQGANEIELLKVRLIGVQDAIIDKLREALKPGGNGGDPNV